MQDIRTITNLPTGFIKEIDLVSVSDAAVPTFAIITVPVYTTPNWAPVCETWTPARGCVAVVRLTIRRLVALSLWCLASFASWALQVPSSHYKWAIDDILGLLMAGLASLYDSSACTRQGLELKPMPVTLLLCLAGCAVLRM
jgi:hypothetical protein